MNEPFYRGYSHQITVLWWTFRLTFEISRPAR